MENLEELTDLEIEKGFISFERYYEISKLPKPQTIDSNSWLAVKDLGSIKSIEKELKINLENLQIKVYWGANGAEDANKLIISLLKSLLYKI